MDGQSQAPNVAKVGSEGRHTGKHTEASLLSLASKGKGHGRGPAKEAGHGKAGESLAPLANKLRDKHNNRWQ